MPKKPLDFVIVPVVFNAFILIGINVAVIELGRRGVWQNKGVGFSPWYPFWFAIIHFLFWAIKIYVDRLCRWWWIIIEIGALIFFMLQSECAWRDNVCILRIAINFASGSVGSRSDMILLNDSLSL